MHLLENENKKSKSMLSIATAAATEITVLYGISYLIIVVTIKLPLILVLFYVDYCRRLWEYPPPHYKVMYSQNLLALTMDRKIKLWILIYGVVNV